MDRQLIAEVIERQMRRDPRFGTWTRLERAAHISHTQMHRIQKGDPQVSAAMFARLEGVLDLPSDTLATVGVHDVAGLQELGVPVDLVQWVAQKVGGGDATVQNRAKAL
jgi:hypothetical protein